MTKTRYVEGRDYDRFTLEDFRESVKLNLLTPDDGTGYYVRYGPNDEMEVSQGMDVFNSTAPAWATHVAWFNK